MLDWLGNLLDKIWEHLWPLVIIEQYEEGVLLRRGKLKRKLVAGPIYWKWWYIDTIHKHSIITTTMELREQSLSSKDDKGMVVKAIIKYKISNIEVFLLEVNSAREGIADMTQGIIKKILMRKTWDECRSEEVDNEITIKARVEAKKWGIEIITVTLTDIGQIRSIRLFNDTLIKKSE